MMVLLRAPAAVSSSNPEEWKTGNGWEFASDTFRHRSRTNRYSWCLDCFYCYCYCCCCFRSRSVVVSSGRASFHGSWHENFGEWPWESNTTDGSNSANAIHQERKRGLKICKSSAKAEVGTATARSPRQQQFSRSHSSGSAVPSMCGSGLSSPPLLESTLVLAFVFGDS